MHKDEPHELRSGANQSREETRDKVSATPATDSNGR
jgi:hypothetical protein